MYVYEKKYDMILCFLEDHSRASHIKNQFTIHQYSYREEKGEVVKKSPIIIIFPKKSQGGYYPTLVTYSDGLMMIESNQSKCKNSQQ